MTKFRVTDTSPVEAGLDFASSVTKEIETKRTKYTYYQNKCVIQWAILKHLYLKWCLLSISMLMKEFRYLRPNAVH